MKRLPITRAHSKPEKARRLYARDNDHLYARFNRQVTTLPGHGRNITHYWKGSHYQVADRRPPHTYDVEAVRYTKFIVIP